MGRHEHSFRSKGRLPFLFLAACLSSLHAQDPAAGTGDGESGAGKIQFVAYNLENYLRMDRRVDGEIVEGAMKPEKEIALIVSFLTEISPDILGVCEIGEEQDALDLQKRLKSAGLDLPHLAWVDPVDPYRHLALLSRFPIVATDHQTKLTYEIDGVEFPFKRGILDATVEVNDDYQLRLLGTHLKSKRPIKEADQALIRRNEAALLRKHVDGILKAEPSTNLLVYGDLNDTRNEPSIRAVQGNFGSTTYLQDIPVEDEDGERWTYHWSYADQYSRIDFVLANKAALPEIDKKSSRIFDHRDWDKASDHRPLVISITPQDK